MLKTDFSRRSFLKKMGKTAAVSSLFLQSDSNNKASGTTSSFSEQSEMSQNRLVHLSGNDVIKIALLGCGPRGSGAAVDALTVDSNTQLIAMGDLQPHRISNNRSVMTEMFGKERITVSEETSFIGFDACHKICQTEADVVIIALPTYFHPHYMKRCLEAGKHVFCEKTHAVDSRGVRMVLESQQLAREKGLALVSGLCWRYDSGAIETMKRVHDGAIGEIVALQETCNCGGLRCLPRLDNQDELSYQIQDWFDFFWLSCDLPGLNLVHHLDKASWAMKEEHPIRCWGMGGRQTRIGKSYGDVWDHHAVVFEYANGVRLHAFCRQQDGTTPEVSDRYFGSKGYCDLLSYKIFGEQAWTLNQPPSDRFKLEHLAMLNSIRNGTPINNGLYMAQSSLMGIMTTWACYTGQMIDWDEAMNNNVILGPENPDSLLTNPVSPVCPDEDGNYPQPVPGITRF